MKNLKTLICVLLYFIVTNTLTAQNNNDIIIEEIIIKDSIKDILNEQTKTSEINSFVPRTAGDIFKSMPGLNTIKRSGFSVEPELRMFKREQLNLMFDGGTKITQSCANRMDAMTTRISAGEIDKIEVIKGPYSVRFGQSFGGVINIITKHPKSSNEFKLHGSGDVAYDFNANGLSSGLEIGGADKKFDFLINGTYRDFGNYVSGNGTEIISSFKAYDYSAKIGYNINKNNRIQASFRHSLAKDVMHAGLPMDALDDDGKLIALDYHYRNSTGLLNGIKFKLYASTVDHLMTNEFKKTFKFTYALAPVESQTLGGKTEFSFSLNDKLNLFAGFDSYYKTRDGVRNREMKINPCTGDTLNPHKFATDKIWQDSYTADYGIFAEIDYLFSNTLKFNGGLRIDFIKSDINDPEEDFNNFYGENLHPKEQNSLDFFGKFDYALPENFNISLAFGKASRTPDLLELFINHSSVGQDAYEYLGNPQLKAEKNMQTDFVISKKSEKVFIYVDLFYSYIKDYITARVDTTVPRKFTPCMLPAYTKQFVNVDDVYQYGFDAGFEIKIIKNLSFKTNAVYTYAQNKTWDEPVAEITPFTINSNLSYKYKKFRFVVNNRFAAEQNRIAVSFAETQSPSFDVTDINITYHPFDFMFLSFGIDNIADVNYYEHTSRAYKNLPEQMMFYEPGRSFKLALKVKF